MAWPIGPEKRRGWLATRGRSRTEQRRRREERRRPVGARKQEGELAWDSGMLLWWSSEEESSREGRATASRGQARGNGVEGSEIVVSWEIGRVLAEGNKLGTSLPHL
jgi:hypothetical protein